MLALLVPTLGLELAPPSSVVVVGGSSGMGKALATSVVQRGGRVLLASRSASKLKAAATEILTETGCVDVTAVATYVVDASDENQVVTLADSLPLHKWEPRRERGWVGAARPITSCQPPTRALFGSKFWSAYHACKHIGPRLAEGGAMASSLAC